MKWCARILIATLLAIIFVFAAVQLRRAPNPSTHGKPASVWCDQLLSGDYRARAEAAEILVAVGEPVIPQLQLMLRRRDSGLKVLAGRLLQQVEYLGYTLPNASLSRERAAEVLAELGAIAVVAAPDLVEALEAEAGRESVLRALRAIGKGAEAELRSGLQSNVDAVRIGAAGLFGDLPSVEPESELAMRAALADANEEVRRNLVVSLGKLHSSSSEQALCDRVHGDPAPRVREKAAEALGKLKALTVQSKRVLAAQMARDTCTSVRFECAKALWNATGEPASILASLVQLLETPEGWKATYLLGSMAGDAQPALPALIKVLRREQVPRPFRTPPSSAFAIGQIGPAALPLLQPLLEEKETRLRVFAAMAIGFMGSAGSAGEQILLAQLKDDAAEVRHATAMSLASIGARGEPVVQGLAECLRAEDIFVRSAAADRLRDLAPERQWFVLSE